MPTTRETILQSFHARLQTLPATALNTVLASIGAALVADRTLGGLCDWIEPKAPKPVDLPVEGAATLKAAVVPVILTYATANPIG